MSESEFMVELITVESSARCDMCGSNNLIFRLDQDSKLYLCRFHTDRFEEALKLTEPK